MLKTLITLILLSSFAYANPTFTVGTDPLIDITSTGQGLNLGDDNMSGMKPLGFDFEFYGQTFDEVNISMNGFFTFQSNFSVPRSRNYRSETLPATSFNYSVFPAWSDYIRRSSGNKSPYIQTFGQTSDTDQYFVVMWDNVSEYSNGLKSTFQAILYETTNEISFRYDELRIQNHDITIGVQGKNEAVTHMRYEDNNSTTYIVTDDFSITTAEVIDESYDNLSSECLVDSSYSTLCDVYDLSYEEDYLEENNTDLMGSGITEAMMYGYDSEEEFYGYSEEDEYLYGGEPIFTFISDGHNHDNTYDVIIISDDLFYDDEYYLEEDIFFEEEFEFFEIHDNDYTEFEPVDIYFIEDINEIDITELPSIEIHEDDFLDFTESFEELRTEEDFLEFVEHFEEEFHEEEFEEAFEEEFHEEEFEEFAETEEEYIEEREEETQEEDSFTEEDFFEEEIDLLQEFDEEEAENKPNRRERVRSIVASTNDMINNLTSNIISSSTSSVQTSSSGGTSSGVSSAVSSGGAIASSPVVTSSSPISVSNSPSISDQIASSQAQTNTVLQSINIIPMPTIGNTPSVVMAEVQVTTMENQIEDMTSTMVTASEADQIADQIVSSNIRAQQEESAQQQEETGEYDTEGQSTLIAYMNYLPGFTTYQDLSIPQPAQWYEPRAIYTDVSIDDNFVAYGTMVGNTINKLSGMTSGQPMDLFGG